MDPRSGNRYESELRLHAFTQGVYMQTDISILVY